MHWVSPRAVESRFEWDEAFVARRQQAVREAYKRFIRSQGNRPTEKRIKETMNDYPLYVRKSDMRPLYNLVAEALTEFNAVRPRLEYYPRPIHHRPAQPMLKIGPKKFYVTRFNYNGTPRQRFYGVIIEALEEGSFVRLRSCKKCHEFFVAKNLKQKFCTPACMKVADQKGAAERVRRMRARRKVMLENAWNKQRAEITGKPKALPTAAVC